MALVARRRDLRWTIGLGVAFAVLATASLVMDAAWHTSVLAGLATCWWIAASSVAVHPLMRHRRRVNRG